MRSGRAIEAKNRDYNFSQDQPWVKTTKALSFVDETTDIIYIHDSSNFNTLENFDIGRDIDNASNNSSPPLPPLQILRSNESGQVQLYQYPWDIFFQHRSRAPSKKRALSPSSTEIWKDTPRLNPVNTISPSQKSDNAGPFAAYSGPHSVESPILNGDIVLGVVSPQIAAALASSRRTDLPIPVENVTEAISGIYLDKSRWPLEDLQETMLFYNFIYVLAPLFDLCDSEQHFATIVPHRAVICPPLMNTVLAASAKRLSRIDGFDGLVGNRYHQNCLDALIPALSSSAAVMDENLLTGE
ncbi:hypothetical protein IL306_008509, partial [Fusarium sp. DS 682]